MVLLGGKELSSFSVPSNYIFFGIWGTEGAIRLKKMNMVKKSNFVSSFL